jgi:CheY-like chemotaxis protein
VTAAEVRACPDAAQAVETWNPDVLIADVAMPNEDGYSLIRKVRALDTAGHRLPAIALTARAYLEDKAAALAADFRCTSASRWSRRSSPRWWPACADAKTPEYRPVISVVRIPISVSEKWSATR